MHVQDGEVQGCAVVRTVFFMLVAWECSCAKDMRYCTTVMGRGLGIDIGGVYDLGFGDVL